MGYWSVSPQYHDLRTRGLEQNGSGIAGRLQPRAQSTTGRMSPRVMLVAAVPRWTDLLTWAWHLRVTFISSILHIDISTIASWILEYSTVYYFIHVFSFKFVTILNPYQSLLFCTCRIFSAFLLISVIFLRCRTSIELFKHTKKSLNWGKMPEKSCRYGIEVIDNQG